MSENEKVVLCLCSEPECPICHAKLDWQGRYGFSGDDELQCATCGLVTKARAWFRALESVA